jgi:LmbE family N-acetylglucosaminyl deacetylase
LKQQPVVSFVKVSLPCTDIGLMRPYLFSRRIISDAYRTNYCKLWSNAVMRIIYLSPHLDDAVLSAGGWILAQARGGVPVEIWTIMSGFPSGEDLSEFAQVMHRIWGFEGAHPAVAARRAEDLRAAAIVGAKPTHFDFLDCIYRRGGLGQALYSDVEVPIAPDDSDLPSQISLAVAASLQPDDAVVCQLAVGGHVDHVIVRRAAEMLDRPLLYAADMPYLLNHPDELEPSVTGMQASFHPVSEEGFGLWIAAIECYTSQIDSVFGSHELMHQRMKEFWLGRHGIRLWTH